MENPVDVEELGQAPEQEDQVDPSTPEQDLVTLIMQITALPQNVETQFLAMSGNLPVKSYDRPIETASLLDVFLQKLESSELALDELFVTMVNEGNFIEIECELRRQLEDGASGQGFETWQQLAMAIASIRANQYFSFKRLYITQVPFVIRGPMGLHATVDEVKVRMLETPGVPPGISPDEISWDTLSFKIPPMGVEYFAQINPPLLDQLTEHSVGVINQLQLKLPEIVKLSFTDYRTQNETVEDPLITDYTAFLETMLGGNMNPRRNHLVKNAGDAVLIQYVNTMYPMFMQGIIPGTILPSKIAACQDIVTMTELRGAIQFLAQEQIIQKGDVINQPNIKQAMEFGATETDLLQRWTVKQSASIRQAQNIDRTLTQGIKSITNRTQNDQAELTNQISGGSNSLRQSLQLNQRGSVVKLGYEQTEMLRQQLSVLLACLRVRFDAVQASKTDMVAQEDIDHFVVCETLCKYLDPLSYQKIHEISVVMREAIVNGHNVVKLRSVTPPEEARQSVFYRVQGYAEVILRAIPFFDADLNEERKYFSQLMENIYISLTDHNRRDLEQLQRYARRKAIFESFQLQLQ